MEGKKWAVSGQSEQSELLNIKLISQGLPIELIYLIESNLRSAKYIKFCKVIN